MTITDYGPEMGIIRGKLHFFDLQPERLSLLSTEKKNVQVEFERGRNVSRKPRDVRGVEGHNMK